MFRPIFEHWITRVLVVLTVAFVLGYHHRAGAQVPATPSQPYNGTGNYTGWYETACCNGARPAIATSTYGLMPNNFASTYIAWLNANALGGGTCGPIDGYRLNRIDYYNNAANAALLGSGGGAVHFEFGLLGGINTYTYVDGKPLRFVDPSGTWWWEVPAIIVSGIVIYVTLDAIAHCEQACANTCPPPSDGDPETAAARDNYVLACKAKCVHVSIPFLEKYIPGLPVPRPESPNLPKCPTKCP